MSNPSKLKLFHVSETPNIRLFEPRPDRRGELAVWAVGEPRLHNYLLPRDCPRITFFADDKTSDEDRSRFLGSAESVVAIESGWFNVCLETSLYLYEFDPQPFSLIDTTACYYVSKEAVKPIRETPVSNVLGALLEKGVELRILPSLWELREAVVSSTLAFSIIRMRNASPPPDSFGSRYETPL